MKVRKLVSDHGSELVSKKTQEYFLEKGVIHIMSPPYTPQQNGFIERDNRTIMESARAMLEHKRVPKKLWGEAVNTTVYVLNRSINKNHDNKTPYELYWRIKPKVTSARIWKFDYDQTTRKKRSGYQKKLDSRSQAGILVGYDRDILTEYTNQRQINSL